METRMELKFRLRAAGGGHFREPPEFFSHLVTLREMTQDCAAESRTWLLGHVMCTNDLLSPQTVISDSSNRKG